MFVRDPVAMAQKAAPFLTFDHDPYAVINNGHIDWVVDGYTTTANYAYSQNAGTPAGGHREQPAGQLQLRAQLGQGRHRRLLGEDDLLRRRPEATRSCRRTRPPSRTCSSRCRRCRPQLQAHLRYPPDIFSIQSAIYGRYHLTNAQAFYAASNAWQLSPTAGAGPQSQALLAAEHLQQPGPAGVDHAGPHGAPVPGVLAARTRIPANRSSPSRTASSRRRSRPSRAPTRTST